MNLIWNRSGERSSKSDSLVGILTLAFAQDNQLGELMTENRPGQCPVELFANTAWPAGDVNLTRHALCQGGASREPIFELHVFASHRGGIAQVVSRNLPTSGFGTTNPVVVRLPTKQSCQSRLLTLNVASN